MIRVYICLYLYKLKMTFMFKNFLEISKLLQIHTFCAQQALVFATMPSKQEQNK